MREIEVSVLEADEVSALVEEGRLQPMDALSVCPRGETAPCYDAWVESSLFEEKPLRFVAEPGVLEESGVARGVEGILSFEFWGVGFVFFYYYVCGIGEPSASVWEGLVQMIHDEVDCSAVCVAGEASVGVGACVECEAGVVVVVEWA